MTDEQYRTPKNILDITDEPFLPGEVWLDTTGQPIQAHGGGMLYDKGTYYWFGENKDGETQLDPQKGFLHRVDAIGISCYSSQDLFYWKNEGVVLPANRDDPAHDLHPSKVIERPKVLRNPYTGKYIMWLHLDTADYQTARTGVAISDEPTGPYQYLCSFQPNGSDSRDMTVFQDHDGKAYLVYSSEWNKTMHIALLQDDYLKPTTTETRIFINRAREAPAMFRRNDRYYLITSGCTGWDPNPAEYAVADNPLGPWKIIGNPCLGPGSIFTFLAQSTYVQPVVGKRDAFIFMADQWKKENLRDSRYAWLPIRFEGNRIIIEWSDCWNLSVFA